MQVTPSTPAAPTRGLRVQGVPWRQWLRTTPGRLRSASAILLLALLLFAVVTTVATDVRSSAAASVQTKSAPELVAAEGLYGSLADADAIASTIYLRAGAEPPQLRVRYLADIRRAGRLLESVSRRSESSPTVRAALRTIGQQLPVYTGLVDTARANIRQTFGEGGAYLRRASTIMREEILPAATDLYRNAARRLDKNYRSGTSVSTAAVVVVVGVAMLGLLVLVQVYVRRRSNRILNVGLVGASVLVLLIMVGTLWKFAQAHDYLTRAQSRGSDSVEVLSSARILALIGQSNANLALIERGSGDVYLARVDRVMNDLGARDGKGGLLGYARELATRTGEGDQVGRLGERFRRLRDVHTQVRKLDDDGKYEQAVGLSVGTNSRDVELIQKLDGMGGQSQELEAVDALDTALQANIMRAQERLLDAADDARTGYGALEVAIPLMAILAGLLVLLGLERRIAEYR